MEYIVKAFRLKSAPRRTHQYLWVCCLKALYMGLLSEVEQLTEALVEGKADPSMQASAPGYVPALLC